MGEVTHYNTVVWPEVLYTTEYVTFDQSDTNNLEKTERFTLKYLYQERQIVKEN